MPAKQAWKEILAISGYRWKKRGCRPADQGSPSITLLLPVDRRPAEEEVRHRPEALREAPRVAVHDVPARLRSIGLQRGSLDEAKMEAPEVSIIPSHGLMEIPS